MVNVLENAVKYTARGGSVRVRTVEEPGVVVVEVVDTGMGVPAADLARLTEPRFRAANATSSAVAGDGLGLALVREVLAAHGGELSVSSVEGEGTTVRLRLARRHRECRPTRGRLGHRVPALAHLTAGPVHGNRRVS